MVVSYVAENHRHHSWHYTHEEEEKVDQNGIQVDHTLRRDIPEEEEVVDKHQDRVVLGMLPRRRQLQHLPQ